MSVITVIISVFSGLLGSLITNEWTKLTEAGILVTRGKSAIRGLNLLVLNIASVEARIARFLADLEHSERHEDPLARGRYEELTRRCHTLQEEALNSIEEWTDIIPEADVKTQIGLLSQLKGEGEGLHRKIAALNEEMGGIQEADEQEKQALAEKLEATERKYEDVQRQLRDKESQLTASGLGGIGLAGGSYTIHGSAHTYPGLLERLGTIKATPACGHCSTLYDPDELVDGKCPHCGEDPNTTYTGTVKVNP